MVYTLLESQVLQLVWSWNFTWDTICERMTIDDIIEPVTWLDRKTNQKINLGLSWFQKKQACSRFYIDVKWSLSKAILFDILSLLITWQVQFYRLGCKLLKMIIPPSLSHVQEVSWNFHRRSSLTKGDH